MGPVAADRCPCTIPDATVRPPAVLAILPGRDGPDGHDRALLPERQAGDPVDVERVLPGLPDAYRRDHVEASRDVLPPEPAEHLTSDAWAVRLGVSTT